MRGTDPLTSQWRKNNLCFSFPRTHQAESSRTLLFGRLLHDQHTRARSRFPDSKLGSWELLQHTVWLLDRTAYPTRARCTSTFISSLSAPLTTSTGPNQLAHTMERNSTPKSIRTERIAAGSPYARPPKVVKSKSSLSNIAVSSQCPVSVADAENRIAHGESTESVLLRHLVLHSAALPSSLKQRRSRRR